MWSSMRRGSLDAQDYKADLQHAAMRRLMPRGLQLISPNAVRKMIHISWTSSSRTELADNPKQERESLRPRLVQEKSSMLRCTGSVSDSSVRHAYRELVYSFCKLRSETIQDKSYIFKVLTNVLHIQTGEGNNFAMTTTIGKALWIGQQTEMLSILRSPPAAPPNVNVVNGHGKVAKVFPRIRPLSHAT